MSDPLWLILSSDYVGQELAAEFGRLPPCFLPVGMKRLFEYQLERIGGGADVWMTIPESFEVPASDRAVLTDAGVNLLTIPDGLSLGEAVVCACNLIGAAGHPLHLLHGDTLIEAGFGDDADLVGIADIDDGYSWAEVECDKEGWVASVRTVVAGLPSERQHPVACGYFRFSDSAELIRCIVRCRGSFVGGVDLYAQVQNVAARRVASWYDFGHLRTFYRSRRFVTTARAFNTLQIHDGRVRKMSESANEKIGAERHWYAAIPPALRTHTARLIDGGDTPDGLQWYETEYEYLPTLAELFVFGSLDLPSWLQILRSCGEFLEICAASAALEVCGSQVLSALVKRKTVERLEQFAGDGGASLEQDLRFRGQKLPSLLRIAEEMSARLDHAEDRPATVMHGDFCFSNILYNSRVRRVRVIDPRGYVVPGRYDVHGDTRYDLAKLGHSILGRYDHIVGGRFAMEVSGNDYDIRFEEAPQHRWVEDAFRDLKVGPAAAASDEVASIIVSLFLSMLPLHADQPGRQQAFIANALRLYSQMKGV